MRATETEVLILNALLHCRFQPGSFDKRFPRQVDTKNISARQQWYIYFLGHKYRKQINDVELLRACMEFLRSNPTAPESRKQIEKILRDGTAEFARPEKKKRNESFVIKPDYKFNQLKLF